jgi:hypothetical protein
MRWASFCATAAPSSMRHASDIAVAEGARLVYAAKKSRSAPV